jgi:Flp pilus assembly protein TadD
LSDVFHFINDRTVTELLEQASLAHPGNKPLLAAYGRALADNGNFKQAFDVLSRAHTPDNPDWRVLSVQGTALDQMGKHAEARGYYASALRIAPDEPSVLSNLGMSYVLSRDLPKAEETLRKAQATGRADARVRQNLALALRPGQPDDADRPGQAGAEARNPARHRQPAPG